MGGENYWTTSPERDRMKWRNWEVVRWPLSPLWWCFTWGYWPNERKAEFKFWNIAFLEVRMFITPREKVCKKCGQELPD